MPPEQLTLILLLLLLLLPLPPSISAVKFDFGTLTLNNLKLIGDAHLKNGSIHLTRELPVPTSAAGRALYSDPIRVRHPATGNPLPFSTFFTFSITNLNPSSIGGGLAFLLCSDDKSLGDAGGFLGLIDSVNPNPATIAVEFDTLMDVPFEDINGNHVGVDLNSMISVDVADLDSVGIDLKSGDLINAWIEYSEKGILQVFVSYSTVRPADPVISFALDLGKFVEEFVFVGFSGSTQGSTEIHSIQWWSFSSASPTPRSSPPKPNPPAPALLPPPAPPPPSPNVNIVTQSPPPSSLSSVPEADSPAVHSPRSPSHCQSNGLCRKGPAAVAGVVTAGAFFVAACAAVGVWAFTRRTRSLKKWTNLAMSSEIVNTPREFSYRELSVATRNFDSSRIIGHGAFGTVYKGIIPETGAMVAVKRCIHNGNGGREEFLSELSIIASLRHRNLVRLQGWCHEKGEILLVYDYMLHGSLDKALFDPNSPALPWRHRTKILTGVACALAYLHRECERQVIHRDVKSSNVMLDEGYQARLGDFGLARQIDHDASPDATVTAGTMGYLAPEYLLTGRATEKTDVFSFGAVVLEVTCGRRPIDGPTSTATTTTRRGNNLVEWVWNLHGEARILEAVDERLGGEFDEGEMRVAMLVGLACSSPDPALRPSMRNVVQMLSGEADPPFVPGSKPSMSFSANHQLLLSLQDSVSDYNALGFNLSTDSSSSDSLSSTLRGGAGGAAAAAGGG